MAVYYKFKSARDFDSIPMDGPFISVGVLKEKIFESKHLGRGTDFDLVVTNAQTNEEYQDEAMLIPKNTSVLIRRVPGRPRMPIVTEQEPKVENNAEDVQTEKNSFTGADSSAGKSHLDYSEWDEFGNDLYAIPEVLPVQSSNPIPDITPTNRADEENKIKALINTPALDWQRQGADGFGPGRGFGRGMGGRMGGRGFGLERKTPPQGYVCHRCNIPGHYIQHCPTNGDPNYDIKRVKPPTGIPKSMLMANPDGSYALPSGAVAILKPNEAAFEREIEGLPSTRSIGDLPPELHCPLCKEVMKDAVLTSKCCFKSFCDKCIRDYIISKSMCVCGASNILADDLLPNKTLRDTINRIMESGNSSAENAGSTFQVQDMESARDPQPKMPSPTMSSASKGEHNQPLIEVSPKMDNAEQVQTVTAPQETSERAKNIKVPDVSEATHDSFSVREPPSQSSAPQAEEEVQQKVASSEAGKKKKKKKVRMPVNVADMQWRTAPDLATENYMMSLGTASYNPYWNSMQPGMDAFMAPYSGGMPYMGYGMGGPVDMHFGGVMPQDPFGAPGYMMPVPPHRDLAFGVGMNAPPPIMSREEFEARKADLRRKRENERRGESREMSRDREYGRAMSSGAGDVSSMKSKSKAPIHPQTSAAEHYHRRRRSSSERSPDDTEVLLPPPRPAKRKSSEHHRDRDYEHNHIQDSQDHRHHQSSSSKRPSSETNTATKPTPSSSISSAAAADRKQKASVFSRISFPEGELSKKRKLSSPSEPPTAHHKVSSSSNGYYDEQKSSSTVKAASGSTAGTRKVGSAVDYESSDDERHFKRKPSRYEPSPPPPPMAEREDERRHSRGSRERDHHRSGRS